MRFDRRYQDYIDKLGKELEGKTSYVLPSRFTPELLEAYMSGKEFAFTGQYVQGESFHPGLKDNNMQSDRIFAVGPYKKTKKGEYYAVIYCNGVGVAEYNFGKQKPSGSCVFIKNLYDPKYVPESLGKEAWALVKQIGIGSALSLTADYYMPGTGQFFDAPIISDCIDSVSEELFGTSNYRLSHDIDLTMSYIDQSGKQFWKPISWYLSKEAQQARGEGLAPYCGR